MSTSKEDDRGLLVLDLSARALQPEEVDAAERAVKIYRERFTASRPDERPGGCSSSSSSH
ncbi:hypothetical protein [Cellulomonas shaoxiangyii]|uniref:Uncharacterized protein n=1 Tax=Cellulomonas shaoxiangyii TaxID=2566013 RepID=A0A4P7SIE8_9CELL|nr:hypothetical protein [Cellulomonas shaoxiangyii]QCB93531.1 hypothetical protein E5225_08110 [Cellulomonas shaoxiangyii]TGY86853.1 hypothetical protein E5226_00430 [Cellulomonas shaoxiangyii]